MGKVRYSENARQDLLDIWIYIASHGSETVADRVYDRIREDCGSLADHPQLGRVRPEIAESARSLVVERWVVFYRLTPDGVQVVRIFDSARDLSDVDWPAGWAASPSRDTPPPIGAFLFLRFSARPLRRQP